MKQTLIFLILIFVCFGQTRVEDIQTTPKSGQALT